jgi:hypothetical protein
MQLSSTTDRVPEHTAAHVNEQIRQATQRRIEHYRLHPEQIETRLRELDYEWDIERTLQANAATLTAVGALLGMTVSRKFMLLPLAVGSFLLQHAVQGWCPPLPILRRMGFRTTSEIQEERDALEDMRDGPSMMH